MTNIDFRREILGRMDELGWSKYRLWRESGLPQRTVYDWLTGVSESTRSDSVEAMLDALGLEKITFKK